jgi:hypothetical protein
MTEREQILKMLAENAGTIKENLSEFWFRHAEDLEAVGIDPVVLTESLINAAVAHLLKTLGAAGAADELDRMRRVVEKLGRLVCAADQERNCSQARH